MSSARREGENIIVTIHEDEVQSLRVALQPCLCRHPKSAGTAALRARFVRGLGMALFSKNKPPANDLGHE